MTIRTITIGVQGDVGGIFAAEMALGAAFDYEDLVRRTGLAEMLAESLTESVTSQDVDIPVDRGGPIRVAGYFDGAFGVGFSFGWSAGVELGFWVATLEDLPGQYWAIEIEAGAGAGGGIGFYFSNDEKTKNQFLGFQIVGTMAAEFDIRYVFAGETITFVKSAPQRAQQLANA